MFKRFSIDNVLTKLCREEVYGVNGEVLQLNGCHSHALSFVGPRSLKRRGESDIQDAHCQSQEAGKNATTKIQPQQKKMRMRNPDHELVVVSDKLYGSDMEAISSECEQSFRV